MKRLVRSFKYAFAGYASAIRSERNWQIGLVEAVAVVLASFYLKISKNDWIVVILLVGLILSAELFNSAIEKVVDLASPTQHPAAKLAKDFAAGAVVILVIVAAIVGSVVFLPYLKG